jgi:uncharacterized protein (UPF0276 family)
VARLAPSAVGLALRPQHVSALARALEEGRPIGVGFLEVLSENYLRAEALPRTRLESLRDAYPLVMHGVSLDLLGPTSFDSRHLASLRDLAAALDACFITDHLAWCASGGLSHHDLLPVPCAHDLVAYAASRIRLVQGVIGRPFGVENVSSYLELEPREMPEWEMLRRIAEEADCGILLDVNNVYVSAHNHGFDPREYLAAVPWDRVLCVHLAGHEPRPDGLLHDTHDRAIDDRVLALYAEAWRRGGPFPTILEWDEHIPALEVALGELERIRAARGAP